MQIQRRISKADQGPMRRSCDAASMKLADGRSGPSLSSPAIDALHEIRTCTPPPSRTDSREDKYSSNRSKDSANNAGAGTYHEADSCAYKAAQYSCSHAFLDFFLQPSGNDRCQEAETQKFI